MIRLGIPGFRISLDRRWLVVAIVLALLLVEYLLPLRLARQGTDILVYLAVLALAALALPRPWLGLAVLLLYGPFAATVRFAGASNLQSLAKDLFALALVGMWLLDTVWSRRRLERSPLDLVLLLYIALAVIQALRGPSLLRGVLALKILLTYVPIYFLVYHNPPRSRRQLRLVIGLFLFVSAVVALYGLYQYVNLSGAVNVTVQIEGQELYVSRRSGQVRVFSTFTHSAVFSLYLALMATLAASLLPVMRRLARLALILLLLLLIGVLPLTLSRIGWIGLGLGLTTLVVLIQEGHRRIAIGTMLIVGLVILLVISPSTVQDTLAWSFTDQDVSFVTRSDLIYWAARMTFVEMPLGCGLGSLSDAAVLASRVTKIPEPSYTCLWQGYRVTGADTVAFAVGVQMGAPGFLLFMATDVIILVHGIRIYRRLHDPFLKALGAGLTSYFVVMTVSNLFSGSTQAYPIVDLYFWFFAGLLLSLGRIEAHFVEQERTT